MNRLLKLIQKYKLLIMYGVFGILTTSVNIAVYYGCYHVLIMPNLTSTAIAWFLAVVFAFITNKIWVFDSKSFARKIVIHELVTFFSCRIITGLLDIFIMYIAVDLMAWNELLWKMVSDVLVIILNFVASKLIIFKNGDKEIH